MDVAGVKDRDVTHLVRGHGEYCVVMEYVLQTDGFGLLRDVGMEEEESADKRRRHHDNDGNECGSNV